MTQIQDTIAYIEPPLQQIYLTHTLYNLPHQHTYNHNHYYI